MDNIQTILTSLADSCNEGHDEGYLQGTEKREEPIVERLFCMPRVPRPGLTSWSLVP